MVNQDDRVLRSFFVQEKNWDRLRTICVLNRESTSSAVRRMIGNYILENHQILDEFSNLTNQATDSKKYGKEI